jgi:hypothetical protein
MVFRIALVQHGAEGRGTGLVQLLLCLSYFVAISASGADGQKVSAISANRCGPLSARFGGESISTMPNRFQAV